MASRGHEGSGPVAIEDSSGGKRRSDHAIADRRNWRAGSSTRIISAQQGIQKTASAGLQRVQQAVRVIEELTLYTENKGIPSRQETVWRRFRILSQSECRAILSVRARSGGVHLVVLVVFGGREGLDSSGTWCSIPAPIPLLQISPFIESACGLRAERRKLES